MTLASTELLTADDSIVVMNSIPSRPRPSVSPQERGKSAEHLDDGAHGSARLLRILVSWLILVAALVAVIGLEARDWDRAAYPWIVLFVAIVSAGVVAGTICWVRGRRLVGVVGLAAPFLPVVGHYLPILRVEDSWAPTMVGDLIGVAAALIGSLVAVVGALTSRSGSTSGG